ncbi:MAG: metal ABC transporter ATP-binding protein [Actinomycetota bacterium]
MRGLSMTPVVIAEGVSAVIGDRSALAPSDFTIPGGSVTAVIGPNGSGKSTLLNLIAGLLQPETGAVSVFGKSPSEGRGRVAYVLQSTKVNETLPVSVREVVTMGRYPGRGLVRRLRSEDRRVVDDALSGLSLSDLAGRSLHRLSGGERQRVLVAQGLAEDHDLLLLDEPLVGLDLISANAIERVIKMERNAGKTVIFSTHDLGQALEADWVLLLAGRVLGAGAPAAILTEDNLALAYGLRVFRGEGGRFMVDDPAHATVGARHVHRSHPH